MTTANINTIVYEQIKTGSIKNVVFFGDSDKMPPPPYVVIKTEADNMNHRLIFRFIVHRVMGEQDLIDFYIRKELRDLLSDVATEQGNIRFYSTDEWVGVQARSDDNTISMERTFFVPIILV
ncbi:MAG: hypothetical protein LBQ37_02470 [Elusimicrobiota bacterium]|jgi:hypothetical protein|nr:hypothetical protein [Elusimicrobiota bacterium]